MRYFKFFSNCILVSGAFRSAIIDLQKHDFYFAPNKFYKDLCDSRSFYQNRNLDKAKTNSYSIEFQNFVSTCLDNDLGFVGSEKEHKNFPSLCLDWQFPSLISNGIIEVRKNKDLVKRAIKQFDELLCFHLQFIFWGKQTYKELELLFKQCDKTSIKSIQVIINFNCFKDVSQLKKLLKEFPRIAKIECFDCPSEYVDNVFGKISQLFFYKRKLISSLQCGLIDLEYFPNEIRHFTEAQHFNTCLNRKLCIDSDGNIKNCLAMESSYGNINNVMLRDIVHSEEFQRFWIIRKDDIDVCRDCEFRYSCTDCRAFLVNPNNVYSKPAKCSYNPYVAKWAHEEGYKTVEDWRVQNPGWERNINRRPLVKIPLTVE